MKAVRVHAYGGPEILRLDELPMPTPGPGQVVAKVAAAGVNFIDTQLRSGLYKRSPPPFSLGLEGAGTIEDIGADVAGFRVGDRVGWIQAPGSYATHALLPSERLVPLPDAITFADAAAALFQGATAHYLAHATYALGPGKTCLVHSAAGGVGLLLCQMARNLGARIIATVSTEAKAALAGAAGAHEVVVTSQGDFLAAVKRLTDGAGVDVVYDAVGRDTFERNLDCLKPRGCCAIYGEASGTVPPFDLRELGSHGSLFLTRAGLNHYTATREEFLARTGDVLRWLAEGRLRLRVERNYPLEEAAEAHRAIESRATSGKLLLLP